MSDTPKAYGHLAAINDTYALPAGAYLWQLNVNTGAASSVVTVYNGTAITDPVVAVIGAAAAGQFPFCGVRLSRGLFVKLTGGTADVTVIAE